MAGNRFCAIGVEALGFFLAVLATGFKFLPRPFDAMIAQENIAGSTAPTAIDFFRRAIGALAWFDSTHGKLLKKSAG